MQLGLENYLTSFSLAGNIDLFDPCQKKTQLETLDIGGKEYPKFINEYWTAKQRQSNAIHEIAYRACFKPELPRFFIELLTEPGDVVFDPFSGRGTTVLEAGLLGRNTIASDINPISEILTRSRFFVPDRVSLKRRLDSIQILENGETDIDLTMFYHPQTLNEIVSIKKYLLERQISKKEDELDSWIRMVATNRLTGHSKGFFSVYTLPPNQATSQEGQKKINEKLQQTPEYRNTKELILGKTKSLTKDLTTELIKRLRNVGGSAQFLSEDARDLKKINNNSVCLTVTSPPFLDIVQYANDNWLRCWFNSIEISKVEEKITMSKKIGDWCNVMQDVFIELYRITKKGGHVAFEVGELRNGKIVLDEYVIPLGVNSGFKCEGVMINQQVFTKTSNIWGVSNNKRGTNTNRIVLFKK